MMRSLKNKTIVLASGGTGGHVFPALSLATELTRQNAKVIFVTDKRGNVFQNSKDWEIFSCSFKRGSGLWGKITLLTSLHFATFRCLKYFHKLKPSAIVGFGGYPSAPALLAGQILKIPTVIHEQNAALGRVNRWLVKRSSVLATHFPKVKFASSKTQVTGNPVRNEILALANSSYSPSGKNAPFNLLVIGGSQGAKIFSEVIPKAISLLPNDLQSRLHIYQQARPEFLQATESHYKQNNINATVQPFFSDIGEKIKNAHLVIARSGASTIAELAIIGRPVLFIPYAVAMDNHQVLNAIPLVEAKAAWMLEEKCFFSENLKDLLEGFMLDSTELSKAAKKIQEFGKINATINLVNVITDII